MKRAAIFGSLVDLKNVNSHKCVRMTIDIPAEKAAEIVTIFGWPTQAEPVPVAIARMVREEQKAPEAKASSRSLSQQAGALCASPVFRAFFGAATEDECAQRVREWCDVESRGEIKAETRAGKAWLDLVQRFHGWEQAEKAGVYHP